MQVIFPAVNPANQRILYRVHCTSVFQNAQLVAMLSINYGTPFDVSTQVTYTMFPTNVIKFVSITQIQGLQPGSVVLNASYAANQTVVSLAPIVVSTSSMYFQNLAVATGLQTYSAVLGTPYPLVWQATPPMLVTRLLTLCIFYKEL